MAKSQRGNDRYTVNIPNILRDAMLEACKDTSTTPSQLIRDAIRILLNLRQLQIMDLETELIQKATED